MIVAQLYTNCLSDAAYFIADNGDAPVLAPLRDVDVYKQKEAELRVKIKYLSLIHI